jgi:hypothetical protein
MNQVEQRIQAASQENKTNLDLSSLDLTSLPDSFLRVAAQLEVRTYSALTALTAMNELKTERRRVFKFFFEKNILVKNSASLYFCVQFITKWGAE